MALPSNLASIWSGVGKDSTCPTMFCLSRLSQFRTVLASMFSASCLIIFGLLAAFAPADGIAFFNQDGRDIGLVAVQHDMPVPHQLPGLGTGIGKAQAVDDVIQPPLQQHQQIFAGNAGLSSPPERRSS